MVKMSKKTMSKAMTVALLPLYAQAALRFAPAADAVPAATPSMICHSLNTDECYPAIFEATEDFQVVHEDQMIPRGLHVRMNLQTGVNEARLDIAGDDVAAHQALELAVPVTPSDSILSTIEDPSTQIAETDTVLDRSYEPFLNALMQDGGSSNHGRPSHQEVSEFSSLLETIVLKEPSQDPGAYSASLEALTDMVHDVELGQSLGEDQTFVDRTWSMLMASDTSPDLRSAITLLWGTALQNNAAALQTMLNNMPQSMIHPPAVVVCNELATLESRLRLMDPADQDVVHATRHLFLASQLCQDDRQYDAFYEAGGPSLLSRISAQLGDRAVGRSLKLQRKLKSKIQNFRDDHYTQALARDIGQSHGNESDAQLEL